MNARLLPFLWAVIGLAVAAAPLSEASDRPDEVPAKVHQRQRIIFPARPLAEGITRGKAIVMLEIDAFGELRDVLVVAYTHRDFADAVVKAVRRWRFTPGSIGGVPAGSNLRLVTDFEVNGVLAYSKPAGAEHAETGAGDGFIYRPWDLAALDSVPAPLEQPAPIYPREWIQGGRTGRVIVEFFVDETGRARFPEVVEAADELLGVAATQAVKEWRFEPPRRHGRPVLARVQQVFNFRPGSKPRGSRRKASPNRTMPR